MSDYECEGPPATRTCKVVNDGCERPAGFRNGLGTSEATASDMEGPCFTCYVCADDVCRACSLIVVRLVWVGRPKDPDRRWRAHRRVRVCAECIESELRDEQRRREAGVG